MATTNHERVGKALDLLKAGLGPFVDRELKRAIQNNRVDANILNWFDDPNLRKRPLAEWDVAALLKLMWDNWNMVFRDVLGPAERGFVGELRGHRNRWAHQEFFSSDDAYRALDTANRLLTAVSAKEAAELDKLKRSCSGSALTSRRAVNGGGRRAWPSTAPPGTSSRGVRS